MCFAITLYSLSVFSILFMQHGFDERLKDCIYYILFLDSRKDKTKDINL